ncbi:MAG: hypothetical protein GWN99_13160 [Gemmatimonadetes bacterium]|uniref:Porin n=1 Tax=Candidatus Kutchimonas denitrificans TaxID=3056748 RepID=A0AAE4Z9M7_9BACT|nr:hypothetical protein [Gemmatimonadota bacterium]NIR75829.1 hypothetical protein [Candidatus Kutchimonas denitrificans]NIS01996.1 hypothetical protein [Gemmatimonadota bacterium]NIT67800.1 hypothetical protein [Gemmatimonadota bacterium]NIU53787.1 hypothetical protein [Gemmatimonadota bacterium]
MHRFKLVLTAVLALCVTLSLATRAAAQQEPEEPLFDELTRLFQTRALSIGALLQTVGTFQADRTLPGGNGFSIGTMRLAVYGELDMGFGYFFQTDFTRTRPLLDASMHYTVAPLLRLDAGLFKVPFSREFLTPAGSIDFVNRARVVASLAPNRQIGVQAGGSLGNGPLAYAVGLFNGNRFSEANTNDNDNFLYAVRLTYDAAPARTAESRDRLAVGFNLAFSRDDDVVLIGFPGGFEGDRLLVGVDGRWTRDRLLVAAELIAGNLDPVADGSADPFGWQATLGYMISEKSQLLFRWDKFEPDVGVDADDLFIFGYNLWPTSATEIQLNYAIPTTGGFEEHQLLVNLQVGF